jgi:pimeloyl-ACP methyl ester carboxylesterase/predicted glycosyltransferase
MRARQPDRHGVVERDGVRIAYEVHGDGNAPTVVLAPTWSIVHSRIWKAQVPYLARSFRVVTLDGRGNGRSDRPAGAQAYVDDEFADDIVAVMDATGTDRAVLVALSMGALWSVIVAARHPERVVGLFLIGPATGLDIPSPRRDRTDWLADVAAPEGWATFSRAHWLGGGYHDFLRFFFSQMFSEPHSTKQIEDCVGWGLDTDPHTLVATIEGSARSAEDEAAVEARCRQVRCPVTVVHGSDDHIRPHAEGERLAALTGAALLTVEGAGHGIPARDPVLTNRLIKDFVQRTTRSAAAAPPRWTRSLSRPKRVLYISSPIGLGHARRDLAIAHELRRHHPDVQIDWLAQHPVTAMLDAEGERVHPGSAWLASESAHIDDECAEHDLHAFQAIRRMDEILVSNFMVFHDIVDAEHYDLVVGDEAWDVDYFLHENPELKRFAFAWMTDFVGWLPMPEGGSAEAALTADYNAEMIEHRARHQRLRDRSIFVGDPGDIVPGTFGPDLPRIRDWTEQEFDFSGYVTGFDPGALGDRRSLRAELGYGDDERVCIVTVGGTGVGESLLRRILDAVPTVRQALPDLSFAVVAGPRIDPDRLPRPDGTTIHRFVPQLHRHLAVCDIAVVQGGLTTCMELTANRRPFIYVPLRNHFEQHFHVRHRLARYGAGRCLPYEQLDPDTLTAAIVGELERPVDYRPVATDGAARAAGLLADLL